MGNSSLDNKNCGDSSEKIVKISTENCNDSKLVAESACDPINASINDVNSQEDSIEIVEIVKLPEIVTNCEPVNHSVEDSQEGNLNEDPENVEEVINQSVALVGHLSSDECNSCEEDCPSSARDEDDKDEEISSDGIGWPSSSEGADDNSFFLLNQCNLKQNFEKMLDTSSLEVLDTSSLEVLDTSSLEVSSSDLVSSSSGDSSEAVEDKVNESEPNVNDADTPLEDIVNTPEDSVSIPGPSEDSVHSEGISVGNSVNPSEDSVHSDVISAGNSVNPPEDSVHSDGISVGNSVNPPDDFVHYDGITVRKSVNLPEPSSDFLKSAYGPLPMSSIEGLSPEDALILSINPNELFKGTLPDADLINIPSRLSKKIASLINPPMSEGNRDQFKDPLSKILGGDFVLTNPSSDDPLRLFDQERHHSDFTSKLAESLQHAEAEIMDASLSQVICKARDLLAEARDLLDDEAEDVLDELAEARDLSDEDEVASPLDIDMADVSSLESLSLLNENCPENVLMIDEEEEEEENGCGVNARRQSVKQDHPYASLLNGTSLSEITKEISENMALSKITREISETISKSSEPLSIESAKMYNDVLADICPHLNLKDPKSKSNASSQSNEVLLQAVTTPEGNFTITHKKETSAPPPTPSTSLSVPTKPTTSRTYSKSAPSTSTSGNKLRVNKLNPVKNISSTSPRSAVSKAFNSVSKHACGHARTVGKVMVTQSSSTKTIVTNVPLPTKTQVESAIKKAVSPIPAVSNSKASTSSQATSRPCGHSCNKSSSSSTSCSKSTDTSRHACTKSTDTSTTSSSSSSPPAPPPSPTTSVNKAFTATGSTPAPPSKATPAPPKTAQKKPETADASTGTEESQPVNCHVTKYSHSWTITNFSKKMKMGNGKSIDSMCFSIPVRGKKTDWSMLLYPNGDKEKVNGSVSLYLTCKHRKGLAMSLEFRFTILDLDGNKKTAPTKSGSITAAMLQTNSSWGWEAFVKQDELQQHNLLPNDRLTVHCDMTLKCLEPEVKPVLPTEIDKRDIDKLVDFVGEISSKSEKSKKKKKKSTSKASALASTEPPIQAQNEHDSKKARSSSTSKPANVQAEASVDPAPPKQTAKPAAPKAKSQSSNTLNNIVNDAEIKEFQVVTRRRGRKNSQSNSNSQKSDGSDTPKLVTKSATKTTPRAKSLSGSSIGNAPRVKTLSESTNNKVTKAPSETSVNRPRPNRTPELKDITIQMNNIQIEAEERHESLEDLLCTAGMLESNIAKIKELEAEKTGQIVKITADKNNKMDAIANSQAELKQRKNMLEKRKEDLEAALADTVAEISEIEILFKRTSDKCGRLTMYLSEHLRDAETELARLGQEKIGLETKMGVVQAKIQAARDKQAAVRGREELQLLNSQIGRLETNLECPICLETAATPIYQCAEGHLVCASCEVRVGQCAVCRQTSQGKSIRNRYAEKDSEELIRLRGERSKLF